MPPEPTLPDGKSGRAPPGSAEPVCRNRPSAERLRKGITAWLEADRSAFEVLELPRSEPRLGALLERFRTTTVSTAQIGPNVPLAGTLASRAGLTLRSRRRRNRDRRLASGSHRCGSILRGPGLVNFGFSLFRRFSIEERAAVETRDGFFRLFNRPRFNLPNRSVDVQQGGVISSLQPARQVQLGMLLTF